MKIYNSDGRQLLDVEVDDTSYRHRVIKGDNNVTLRYSLAEHIELPVGAYCLFGGERYSLLRPESFKMKHSRNYDYTVILEAEQAKAKIWKFRNPVDGRIKFPLTAKPIEHLQMFVDNMNRRDSGWSVGKCIEGVERLVNYDNDYCWDALSKMSDEFETEFEIVGKVASLHKVEYNKDNPLPLAYGIGNGFKPNIGRANVGDKPPVEILFAEGGSDNIDRSKYGSATLLLPKLQSIAYDGEHFEGEAGFVAANARRYVVDDLGMSIRRADRDFTMAVEDTVDCTNIYPKRVGIVSSVVVEDAAKNFYDIVDNTIPSSLNFEDCLIEGETMTVVFQSGMLAGKEFEVKYYHNSVKSKAARRFEIVPQEIDGETMPGGVFIPRVGDTYAVFNCMLPDSYIRDDASKSGTSWDMLRAAVKYMYENEELQFSFSGELDGLWAKKDWVNIGGRILLGGYVLFRNEDFAKDGVRVRITGIKDYINEPHSPSIELSNQTVGGGFSGVLNKLQSEEVTVEENLRQSLQFTKRRFRDARETMDMLEQAMLDNFTNSISPITVQTMAMLVGDESLQFRFVNSKTNPQPVAHAIVYDNAAQQLKADAGIVQHLTLGISSVSASRAADEYKYWSVEPYTSARLDDTSAKYYLYIKASKTDGTAVFTLSEASIKMEGVSGYYHFLVGILNSEYDEERSFATLYGFTEILPGRITTDKVVSGDGQSFLDLVTGAMKLGDCLDYNLSGDKALHLKFLFSENSNLGGWIFRNNRLESQNGSVYLDGVNGKVRLDGTIQLSTGYDGAMTDVNIFWMPSITSRTYRTMPYDRDDIGKVCRLFNSSPFGGASYVISLNMFSISPGITMIMDSYTVEVAPQETVELTCFERYSSGDSVQGSWEITNRFGFLNFQTGNSLQGRFPLLFAMGRVDGWASGASITGTVYDGRSLSSICSASRTGTGRYRLTFTTGVLPSGCKVLMTGYTGSGGTAFTKGAVVEYGTNYIDISVSAANSAVDGGVEIFIFAPSWQYNTAG